MKRSSRKPPVAARLLSLLKIAVLACILTAVLVLILALTMRWDWVNLDQADGINTAIKALSACGVGVMFALRRERRGWVLAGIAGVTYMALAFAVFGVLNGSFHVSVKNVSDLLMAFACASCTCILVSILLESREQKREKR